MVALSRARSAHANGNSERCPWEWLLSVRGRGGTLVLRWRQPRPLSEGQAGLRPPVAGRPCRDATAKLCPAQ